jgi:hypothetical protein
LEVAETMNDERGFVLSGIALLLVLPALLLAAACVRLAEIGGEAVSLQGTADLVFYTAYDVQRTLELIWEENLLFDNLPNANRYFERLAENYRMATGLLVDLVPRWMLWIHAYYDNQDYRAGTGHSKVARVSQENWIYYFDIGGVEDWNEPILKVVKQRDNLKIILQNYHFPVSPPDENAADIYYSTILLWSYVIHDDPRIGSENTVPGTTTQLAVSISVKDPNDIARYSSLVELG